MPHRWRWFALFALAAIAAALLLRKPLARHWVTLGIAARGEWRLDDALRHFDRAVLLDRTLDGARIEAGITCELRGELTRSLRWLRAVDTDALDNVNAARHANALGTALFLSNDAGGALREHRRALALARAAHDRRREAEAHIGIGRVLYHAMGRADESTQHLEGARAIAAEIRDEGIEAGALRHLAVVRWWLGNERGPRNLQLTETAIAKYRRVGDLRGEATALSNLGMMHNSRWDTIRYLQLQNASIRIRERIGDRAGLADSWASLADNYSGMRNDRKASEYLLRALETSRAIGYRLNENEVEAKLAMIYVRIGEYDAALPLFERLLERERGNSLLVKMRTSYLADVHRFRGDPAEALRWAHRAMALDRATGHQDKLFGFSMWLLIADAQTALGNLPEAGRAMARADEVARQFDADTTAEVMQSIVRADLLFRLGRPDEALRLLEAAADHEMDLFRGTGTRVVWTAEHYWYDRLFQRLLRPDGSPALAIRFLEQLRYRSLLDMVLDMERVLRTRIHPRQGDEGDSVALAAGRRSSVGKRERPASGQRDKSFTPSQGARAWPHRVDEIQHALEERSAIVEYIGAGRSLHAVVITSKNVTSIALPISGEAVATKVRLLRALMFDSPRAMDWIPVATDLRRVLIEPLEAAGALDHVQRLEIVPWGSLRELPFAVLRSDRRFLIEDYVIGYAPSASAAVRAWHPVQHEGPAMVFGLGHFPGTDLPELRQAEAEARQIAASVGGEVRVGVEATEAELVRVAPRARALHFATHAIAEPEMPLLSRLALMPGDGGDGNLTIAELLAMPLQAELVTLGACRTAESHPASGRRESDIEPVGLVEAFLHAGARAVLASLAPVGDRSTSIFMRRYYTGGLPSDPAARLAAIQRALIRGEVPEVRHPRHWGAFVVYGGAM